jgi:alpha-tubulin suppressor-like RCC1 family protein
MVPAVALAGTLAAAACGGGDAVEPGGPELAIRGRPGSVTIVADVFCPLPPCGGLAAGDSMHFVAYRIDDAGVGRALHGADWQVSDTAVATVSREGWLRGRKPGAVQLIASQGQLRADTLVEVTAARIAQVRVTAASSTVPVGGTVQLTATVIDVLGHELPGQPVSWFVHNPAAAKVDEKGVLSGANDGHAIVSAFASNGVGGWIGLQIGSGVPSAAAFSLADVSVGAHHTCGVAQDGAAYCWGWNFYGQLGQGYTSGQEELFGTPLRVQGGEPFLAVSGGSYHTCALTPEGRAWCWGGNMSGQLGHGIVGGGTPKPAPVEGNATYRSVSGGGDHTCALRTDGVAVCWGANAWGQVGNGSPNDVGTPTPVVGSTTFSTVRAGLFHTCALDGQGAAYCWGDNMYGQVGDGKLGPGLYKAVPTTVRTPLRFTALETSAAASHTCALNAAGEAYCWGINQSGQLGDGTRDSRARPVRVNTTLRFTALALGAHHTCGITADGTAHCWGNNDEAQLGDHTLTSRLAPGPVATALRFKWLRASNNTTCGKALTGGTYCWGANASAQLGAGFAEPGTLSAMPLPVAQP